MHIVSPATRLSTVVSYRDQMDAIAEREAMAIAQLAEMTDNPLPVSRLNVLRDQAIEAAERGLPKPKRKTYGRVKSMRAHRKIQFATISYLVHGSGDKYPHWDDAVTRIAKRLKRAAKLFALKSVDSSLWVGLSHAAQLTGIGERTLQRAAASGRINARRDFTAGAKNGLGRTGRWLVQVDDVRGVLQRKLSGKSVA